MCVCVVLSTRFQFIVLVIKIPSSIKCVHLPHINSISASVPILVKYLSVWDVTDRYHWQFHPTIQYNVTPCISMLSVISVLPTRLQLVPGFMCSVVQLLGCILLAQI